MRIAQFRQPNCPICRRYFGNHDPRIMARPSIPQQTQPYIISNRLQTVEQFFNSTLARRAHASFHWPQPALAASRVRVFTGVDPSRFRQEPEVTSRQRG